MTSLLVLVTAAALGVEAGWEPLPEGGHEYTIQIEPQLLDLLKRGEVAVTSEVPPELQVRRYRVVVGQGKLVREVGHAATATPHTAPAPTNAHVPAHKDRTLDSLGEDTFHAATPKPPAEPRVAQDHAPRTQPHQEAEPEKPAGEQPFGLPPVEEEAPAAAPGFSPAETVREPAAEPSHPAMSDENSAEHTPHEASPPVAAAKPKHEDTPRDQPGSIDQAAYDRAQKAEVLNKPELPPVSPEKAKPWLPFLTSMFLLGCSIGGNIYLGWIAWDARHRYRNALSKFRAAPTG